MSDPQLGFQGYSGRLGQWIFSRRNGRVVVSRAPTGGTRASTPAQDEVKLTFRSASAYARKAQSNPTLRPRYETVAASRNASVYQVAMADYLRTPWIESINLDGYKGLTGSPIPIAAFDDVDVMSVMVEIRSEDGTLLEEGAATQGDGQWVYVTTQDHPAGTPITITATAVDRPGRKGSKFATWS
jgi:hypothetical protein